MSALFSKVNDQNFDVDVFKIRRADDDPRPHLIWDKTVDLAGPVRNAGQGGTEDATIAIRLNVDDGMWDDIAADLGGFDVLGALDRAISVLTEARGAVETLIGSQVHGMCLARGLNGDRCEVLVAHETHSYRPAGGS